MGSVDNEVRLECVHETKGCKERWSLRANTTPQEINLSTDKPTEALLKSKATPQNCRCCGQWCRGLTGSCEESATNDQGRCQWGATPGLLLKSVKNQRARLKVGGIGGSEV